MSPEPQAKIVAIPREKAVEALLTKALAEFAVLTVGPGAGVADEVERFAPDLILLDVGLQGQDGYEICKQLHARRQTRDIPILFVTRSTAEARAYGADADGIVAVDDQEVFSLEVSRLIDESRVGLLLREAVSYWETGRANELTVHELSVLSGGGFDPHAISNPKPIVDTVREYKSLTDESLDVPRAADRLGVTEGRIRQRLTAKPPELYGIRHGKAWVLPAFQFTSEGLVPHLEKVIPHLPRGLNPVAVARFFTLPSAELEVGGAPVSPITWLARGEDWQLVAELAEDVGGLA